MFVLIKNVTWSVTLWNRSAEHIVSRSFFDGLIFYQIKLSKAFKNDVLRSYRTEASYIKPVNTFWISIRKFKNYLQCMMHLNKIEFYDMSQNCVWLGYNIVLWNLIKVGHQILWLVDIMRCGVIFILRWQRIIIFALTSSFALGSNHYKDYQWKYIFQSVCAAEQVDTLSQFSRLEKLLTPMHIACDYKYIINPGSISLMQMFIFQIYIVSSNEFGKWY